MQYGKDWKKVEQYVKTRSGSQVRSHAQKFFNKLQKQNQPPEAVQRGHQEFSETEFDMEREVNNDVSTPLELVSLIKRQSKEEGNYVLSDRGSDKFAGFEIEAGGTARASQQGEGVAV